MHGVRLLESLLTPTFDGEIIASTPRVLRSELLSRQEVARIRSAYREGTVTSSDIREFMRGVLAAKREAGGLGFQTVIAALAVALECFHDAFSEEYLRDLSALRREGFEVASRVASECLRAPARRTENDVKVFSLPLPSLVIELKSTEHIKGDFGSQAPEVVVWQSN